MLPHILHSTTRAAAVVQNQAQVLKSVLQIQSSGPSSGSNSSRGNGPSSGGSKFNAGSRFHAGLNSAGRAVSQANVVSSHDGTVSHSDEIDDTPPRRTIRPSTQKRQRIRSSSVSLNVAGRSERGENMGVLQTVQIHARAMHAFAPGESLAVAKQRLLADPVPSLSESDSARSPLLVRRNSTSAPLSPLMSPVQASVPLPEAPETVAQPTDSAPSLESLDVDAAAPRSVTEPHSSKADSLMRRIRDAGFSGNANQALDVVRHMLTHDNLLVEHFNAAFDALLFTRTPGEPLNPTIRLYNQMLDKSVVPNVQTYERLIHALLTRDYEIAKARLALEQRAKRVHLLDRDEVATMDVDRGRIEKLSAEDNFPSAMSLFEGILAIGGRDQLSLGTFLRLFRACANNGDWKAAVHIFAQMEAIKTIKPNHAIYKYIILACIESNRLQSVEEVFTSYLDGCKSGYVQRPSATGTDGDRQDQVQTWNAMIEAYFRFDMPDKAVELVGRMVSSTAGNDFTIDQIPVPTSSTFTTVITGFVLNGDIKSALSWFDKLLAEEKAPVNPFQGLDGKAMRPDTLAWYVMLDALAREGMLSDLNRLYKLLKEIHVEDHITIRTIDNLIVFRANLDHLDKLSETESQAVLSWLTQDIFELGLTVNARRSLIIDVCIEHAKRGDFATPFMLMTDYVVRRLRHYTQNKNMQAIHIQEKVELGHMYITVSEAIYQNLKAGQGSLPWTAAMAMWRLGASVSLQAQTRFAPYVIASYGRARFQGQIVYEDFQVDDWDVILRYATFLESSASSGSTDALPAVHNEGGAVRVASVLQDMASHGVTFDAFADDVRQDVMEVLAVQYGGEHGRNEFLSKLGPTYAEAANKADEIKYGALENALSQPTNTLLQPAETTFGDSSPSSSATYIESEPVSSPTSSTSGLAIHALLTKSIASLLESSTGQRPKLSQAYNVFEKNLRNGFVPEPAGLAKLIQAFGRHNHLDKVREFYTVAQDVFPLVRQELQLECWAHIEDSMIIALAHAGYPDAAHVHRLRILEQDMVPSADAYGVLIQHVKDTTDDTSGAMALFNEAAERGVTFNLYLYNNIISKLSKARKADHALELFQQMKASGLAPSSITYGTVIGACARVGDVKSAEALFNEMTHAKNFKPRVPPYNTMMQLYTTTKPNRTSALYYYNELRKAGVKPSAHTYKLLLDTYGSIEPIDTRSVERVFNELQDDLTVELTGAHFAALINAYGCVAKDLDKAITIFNSMPNTPRAPTPDAVVFEAVINVLVAHKRTDLLPVYIEKMNEAGVHMTAYIANFLIKGYANVGNLDRAREIFESLVDPPFGVAAPNNHAPHNPTEGVAVNVMEPVFREPSTWETMVRAELGAGNRDAALDLLDRLHTRGYPEAVYNRISGVMTDHSAVVA